MSKVKLYRQIFGGILFISPALDDINYNAKQWFQKIHQRIQLGNRGSKSLLDR